MSNAAQKMIKARANLVMGNPFFGTLALRLKMVEDKTVKLSSTDGTVLRYNPDAVAEMPLSKVQGMLAHTVMHPAMLHHTRRGARDKAKWNKACDYSINTILSNAGFDLPEGKYINPAYAGMTAEHCLERLRESMAVITPGDRSDVVLAIASAHAAEGFPSISCLILNGGLPLHPSIAKLVAGLGLRLPIVATELGTYDTARAASTAKGRVDRKSVV